ncbi:MULTISPECIES: P63C domain-containing protein [unclassified Curtobacterium]|uniref:P63C domain-containing protein n=1 Tax=unclassified Curtobacterium TaxID=257496 RepID=UPI0038123BAF
MSDDNIPEDGALFSPSEGGKARARALSPAQRQAVARRAAEARWRAKVPNATHAGVLDFAGTKLDCAVLADGTRLVSQGDVMTALGRAASRGRSDSDNGDAPFLRAGNLKPFISPDLETQLKPISYREPGARFPSTGYLATLLPDICDVYLAARRDGRLLKTQERYAESAEILMRSLAKVGIVALVDEATGYEKVRDRDELQRLLAEYVDESFRPWVKRFPDDFFAEVQRIYGHEPSAKKNRRPQYIGRFINEYIYKQFPDGVLDELQRVNPVNESGTRARTHHQHLTPGTGNVALDRQISSVVTLMKISHNSAEFKEFYARRFPTSREILRVTPTDDGKVVTLFEMEDFSE